MKKVGLTMDLILILNEASQMKKKSLLMFLVLRVYFYYNQKLEGFNQRTSLHVINLKTSLKENDFDNEIEVEKMQKKI